MGMLEQIRTFFIDQMIGEIVLFKVWCRLTVFCEAAILCQVILNYQLCKTSASNEFSSSFCSRSCLVTEIFGGAF
jgi:hypothetical protein